MTDTTQGASPDQSPTVAQSPSPAPEASASSPPETESASPAAPVNKARLLVILLIVSSLVWSLLADRFTPSTTQARVAGYVVGVAPRVAGLVTRVFVTNNTRVEKGQKLLEIDRSVYDIALAKARSDLETVRRQVGAGSSAVDAARASLKAAEANRLKAEQDFSRLKTLREQDAGSISVRRLEVSRASFGQAEAAVAKAEAGIQQAIDSMGGQDEASNAKLKAAQTAVAKAELDLANTTVVASLTGTITNLRTDVGQFAGAGSPVLTLISMHDVWVVSEFSENNLGNISAGSPCEILFDSLPGSIFEGRVRSIGRGISAAKAAPAGTLPSIANNRDWLRQSQRFPVIVEFDPNQSRALRKQLRIGGQATVIAYAEGHGILRQLGEAYIRMKSVLSYAY
jgi:multidrug resistance efflux pump